MISKIPGYDYSENCHTDFSHVTHDILIYKEITTILVSTDTTKKSHKTKTTKTTKTSKTSTSHPKVGK